MASVLQIFIQAKDRSEVAIDAAKKKIKGLGDQVKKISLANIAALGGVAFAFDRIKDKASDLEESLNKTREVFGQASKSVEDFANRASGAIGSTRQSALAMTSEIGNLLVSMGLAEDAAADMSIDVVKLAADLGSFNNVRTEDALMAIRAALIGSSEPMLRFGSDTRITRLEQVALRKGLIESGQQMDAQTKALVALEAIYQDTRKAQGDFARTSESVANKTKIVTAEFEDQITKLGEDLLPIYSKFLGIASDAIKIFDALPEDIQTTTLAVTGLTVAVRALGISVTGIFAALGPAGWAVAGFGLLFATLYEGNDTLNLTTEQFDAFNDSLGQGVQKAENLTTKLEELEKVAKRLSKLPMYSMIDPVHIEAERKLKAAIEETGKAIQERTQLKKNADFEWIMSGELLEEEFKKTFGLWDFENKESLENWRKTREAEVSTMHSALTRIRDMRKDATEEWLNNLDANIQKEKAAIDKSIQIRQNAERLKKEATVQSLANIADALVSFTNQNAGVVKAGLTAQAIMDTYAGANRALGAYPPPFSFILAAAVIAKGLANVVQIQSAGMARGGIITGQREGTDTVPVMLSPGEAVIPSTSVQKNMPAIQELISGKSVSGSKSVQFNINIPVSAIDGLSVKRMVDSPDFRKALVKGINEARLRLKVGNQNVSGVL